MTANVSAHPARNFQLSPVWLVVVGLMGVGGWLLYESWVALAVALMEGVPAVTVIALSASSGIWIVRLLKLTSPSRADRIIVGSTLGVGLIAFLVLLLGSAGLLSRIAAMLLVIVLSVLGVTALLREFAEKNLRETLPATESHAWLWLLVIPFAAIAASAACLPPGVLWEEEGRGYDVLEYHLAIPKTFATDGRIHFIPNNVFCNFPMNGEMLSLLLMRLRGNPIEAAFMATFVNIALAALFVAAAWWAGSAFGPLCATISGIAAATVPWLVYLSGIAYVETGMLATGMAAFALLLHATRRGDATWRTFLTAGFLAGISCGFKYTAIPMIAAPLAILPLWGQGSWPARGRRVAVYSIGAVIAFSPWMIRNIINTRNPVFPLAYSIFGSKPGLWDESTQAVWQRATSSSEAENNAAPMWQRILERTIAEPLTGWSLFVLAAIGAVRQRDRWTLALLLILGWQLLFWLSFTHIFARFAVVFVLPLVVLAGRSFEGPSAGEASQTSEHPQRGDARFFKPRLNNTLGADALLVLGILILGIATNVYRIGSVYYHDSRPGGVRLDAFGHTDWFIRGEWPGTAHWGAINGLPPGSRVLMVGEARTFYLTTPCDYAVIFNRHPLAKSVRENPEPAAIIEWLRRRGTTHVLVHQSEVDRFLRTYGFYNELTPELFDRLEAAGLKRVGNYSVIEGETPYATLYEVPLHG